VKTRGLFAVLLLAACGEPSGQGGTTPMGAGGSGAGTGPSGTSGDSNSTAGSTTAGTSSGVGASAQGGSAGSSPGGGAGGSIPIIEGPPPPVITITEYAIPMPSQPGWIAAGPDGNLWFTHQSTAPSAVSKITPAGTPVNRYNVSTTNIGPRGIAPGPDGNVWYAKQGGIGLMQPSGQYEEVGVPSGGDSAGICLGPDGNVWFTQQIHNKISRITPGKQFAHFDVPTAASGPLAITAGPDGNLWFTEAAVGANKIGRLTPAGEFMEFAIPTAASNPTGITVGPDDNLWFTEHDANKIGRITPQGEITEFFIPSGNSPGRIVAGPDGNLWFTQSGSANSIGRITPLGQVSEYEIPTAGSDPYDIVVGPDDNLWFTEISANKIGRISNLGGGGDLMAKPVGAMGGGELGGDTPCTKDNDCQDSGKACGGDVCSAEKKLCVLAVTDDPGSCGADADCWCQGEGATCMAGHCTFTVHGALP
jgi:streptogramin lyase